MDNVILEEVTDFFIEFKDSSLVKDFITIFNSKEPNNESNLSFIPPLVAYTSEKSTVYAKFFGNISDEDSNTFHDCLDVLVTDAVMKVILDFSESSLSRSAIGMLFYFASMVHGRGKRLYLYKPSNKILDEFKELNISLFFTYLNSKEDLIESFVV